MSPITISEELQIICQEADGKWLCFDPETGLYLYLTTSQVEEFLLVSTFND